MKIVHVSLVAYMDGWGYQENLLSDYMADAGHEVVVVASSNHFPNYLEREEVESVSMKGNDYWFGKIHIYRIPTYISTSNYSFFCRGLISVLEKEQPDVIFHHDINSSSMLLCWLYCRRHKEVRFFVDNHADKFNQSECRFWNMFVICGLMRVCTNIIQKRVSLFYGVTPGRCSYLIDVFGAPESKVKLLPIGADVNAADAVVESKMELRRMFSIPDDLFVVVSGGKMGRGKGTVDLIEAIEELGSHHANLQLLLFGSLADKESEERAKNSAYVRVIGWCDRETTMKLFKMADAACWPVHHTTLIEDALAMEVPLVIRKTSNTQHLIDSNGIYLQRGTADELADVLERVIENISEYKKGAVIMRNRYSYAELVEEFFMDCKQPNEL